MDYQSATTYLGILKFTKHLIIDLVNLISG